MADLPPPRHPLLIALTEAEVEAVADLYARCADYFLLQDGEQPTLEDAHGLFTDLPPGRTQHDQSVLGWKEPNGLAAVAAILHDYPRSGTWYLGFLIVDRALRGQGMGGTIYRLIEDWAATQGVEEIRLAVLEANAVARLFWRSFGFEDVRRVGPDQFKSRTHFRIEMTRALKPDSPELKAAWPFRRV